MSDPCDSCWHDCDGCGEYQDPPPYSNCAACGCDIPTVEELKYSTEDGMDICKSCAG